MSITRMCWIAACTVVALVMIGLSDIRMLPWVGVPGVILVAYSFGPLIAKQREERRIKAEAAEGLARLEVWLRSAPGVTAASFGAAAECCPICGAPVDPRNARCRRHGAAA